MVPGCWEGHSRILLLIGGQLCGMPTPSSSVWVQISKGRESSLLSPNVGPGSSQSPCSLAWLSGWLSEHSILQHIQAMAGTQ